MYDTYTDYIESFIESDINKWSFKSNPSYCGILEHVTHELGFNYLIEISNRFDAIYNKHKELFIDLCKKNDTYGKTIQYNYNGFTTCSPTNLRYILHSILILTYMKECSLNYVDIIEIGGGYGGLCFYMFNLSKLFGININSYSIFDLKTPMKLQQKYLTNLDIHNVNFVDIKDIKHLIPNSFLISNYAFSEISNDLRIEYTSCVINPFATYGFMAWNCIDIYKFVDGKYIMIEDEYPLTGEKNKYIRFKPFNYI
jgi:hypothetical protein